MKDILNQSADDYILALKIIENSNFLRKDKDLMAKGVDLMFHLSFWKNNDNKNLFPEESTKLYLEGIKEFAIQDKGVKA